MHDAECKKQSILRRLVERDVVCCVSTMMYELRDVADRLPPDSYEDYLALVAPPLPDNAEQIEELDAQLDLLDSELEAIAFRLEEIEGVLPDVGGECAEELAVEHVALRNQRKVKEAQRKETEDERDQLDAAQDEYPEVYEHWVVSHWAAHKLKERGEIVGEFLGLTIWGRQCTGQSIYMDSVWEQIAHDMEILPGQQNDWSDKV